MTEQKSVRPTITTLAMKTQEFAGLQRVWNKAARAEILIQRAEIAALQEDLASLRALFDKVNTVTYHKPKMQIVAKDPSFMIAVRELQAAEKAAGGTKTFFTQKEVQARIAAGTATPAVEESDEICF